MRLPLILLPILGMLTLASPVSARKWTDTTGAFSTDAELVEVKEQIVVLKKQNGAILNVPLEKLCKEDQDFIAGLSKPAAEAASAPPVQVPQTSAADQKV